MSVEQLALFAKSWSIADQYPLSLMRLGANVGSLRAHQRLLKAKAEYLFRSSNKIPILEFFEDETLPGQILLANEKDLLDWLNISTTSSGSAVSIKIAPAPKARCRFIFFESPSTETKLMVSLKMASQILTCFQVLPSYVDFLTAFSIESATQVNPADSVTRVDPVELRFSGFRERVLLSKEARGFQLSSMALNGRNYQLCYNLKCVALKIRDSNKENWVWSPRQGSFHHQFDLEKGTTLWIVTSRIGLHERVKELTTTGEEGRPEDRNFKSLSGSFISSLAVHLMLAQWATEDWRSYIRWLEQVLEGKTQHVLQDPDFVPAGADVSFVQTKQDQTNKAIMMLNANADILSALHQFYQNLMKNDDFALKNDKDCKFAVADFLLQLQDFVHEFKMHAARATTVGKITADRKDLVQQHIQAHSSQQMELLTEQAQREAVNMRVIAIMTFLLLPATFVSTFFSTDVVKYQNGGNDNNQNSESQQNVFYESYSALAMQRWFEVTVPLTVVTFALASCVLYWSKIKTWPRKLLGNRGGTNSVSLRDEEKVE